jgi:UDP-N-acetylglucosamine--N-acetylmuramyl-(pentapeptide) pyrophosphoryl-undecaprenol N-acetylglucosamine transferase
LRLALSGGGTAGHVYPCLAVASSLRRQLAQHNEPLALLYLGVRGRVDEQVMAGQDVDFKTVSASALRVRSPLRFGKGLADLVVGTQQARGHLRDFHPQAVFATGGYTSAPVALAARSLKRPLLVYLPDIRPGWAVRLMARLATRVAATAEASLPYLPAGKTAVSGYPPRETFFEATKEEGQRRLNLDPNVKTLLVSGGSLGARVINQIVAANLPAFLQLCQIVHLSGAADFDSLERRANTLPEESRRRYHLFPYLADMPWAMAAADLALMRAGASALGELPLTGLPAILVPGSFSDQAANAAYLANRGAAIVLPEKRVDEEALSVVSGLLKDEKRLRSMSEAMRSLARPDAADRLASMIMEIAA